MTNWKLIEAAVAEIEDYQGSTATINHNLIFQRCLKWYNNTEITNPYILAAVGMSGEFDSHITHNDIMSIYENYYPSPIYNNVASESKNDRIDTGVWAR